jgi:hypothetical protein
MSVVNQAAGNETNRVIITPTLSTFTAGLDQARSFQQYRITKISYQLFPIFNTSYVNATTQTQLPLVYDVPITGL